MTTKLEINGKTVEGNALGNNANFMILTDDVLAQIMSAYEGDEEEDE